MVKRRIVGSCGVVLVVCLFLAGCTPDPGPSPTVGPVASASSPAASPTPSENAEERRQRLDFEAAEKAYRTASAETARLAMAGGASKATKTLLATTGGFYLKVQMNGLKVLKVNGWRADRPPSTSVSASGGWSPDELGLTACEDASRVKLLDKNGKEVAKDRDRRFVQALKVTKVDDVWKVTDGDSKAVESFTSESGCTR